MQRYFIKDEMIHDEHIQIDTYILKHMKQVMRYKNNDEVICIQPDTHVFLCRIEDIDNGLLIKEREIDENNELDVEVTLIYGLPKGDKFEFILQKATELGVKRIVPFLSKRSVIKTDEQRFFKKYERYQKILTEASEQSCRQCVPEITPLATMKDIAKYLSDVNIVAYEESSRQSEHSAFYNALHSDYKSITIIVGPEGGFEQKEIDDMKVLGVKECSLGKRILRSETAPLYMLSVIGYSRELMK